MLYVLIQNNCHGGGGGGVGWVGGAGAKAEFRIKSDVFPPTLFESASASIPGMTPMSVVPYE
jgi:hypothetical protein